MHFTVMNQPHPNQSPSYSPYFHSQHHSYSRLIKTFLTQIFLSYSVGKVKDAAVIYQKAVTNSNSVFELVTFIILILVFCVNFITL